MGLAYDTVLMDVHNAATSAIGLTVPTLASGDSLAVRSFDKPAWAKLLGVTLQGSGTRQVRLTSPRLHDNVTGLQWQTPESPSEFLLPSQVGQPLYSVDQLVAQMDAAASSDTIAALHVYYKNLEGEDAQLRSWGDIKGHVIGYKIHEVAVTTSATIGAWQDTTITTTDNQLKADYRYALLGMEVSAALGVVGLKGPATGNLRACMPGASATFPLSEYFIRMSEKHDLPMIPIFKANDRNNTFVSAAANTASVTSDVFLMLAWLDN